MCEICDQEFPASCPDCGSLVCWDVKGGDDVIKQAVSFHGDLLCIDCALSAEAEEERNAEEEWGWMEFDPYDGEVWLEDEDYVAQWEEEGNVPFLEDD